MIRTAALCAFVALSACESRQVEVISYSLSDEDRLAQFIETKGCQLGPVRAAEARSTLGFDEATFASVIQNLKDQGRVSIHTDGQVELMSEICI